MQLLLVDDHALVLQGLQSMLSEEPEIEKIFTANSVEEALGILQNEPKIRLVLTDLQMPRKSGFDLIMSIQSNFLEVKVIAVSMLDDAAQIQRALSLGVHGYVMKNEKKENLLLAIRTVAMGGQYTSPVIMKALMNKTQEGTVITSREKEICIGIAQGKKNHEIAEQLHISSQTVATHRKNIYRKLNISNTAALVNYMSEQGWL